MGGTALSLHSVDAARPTSVAVHAGPDRRSPNRADGGSSDLPRLASPGRAPGCRSRVTTRRPSPSARDADVPRLRSPRELRLPRLTNQHGRRGEYVGRLRLQLEAPRLKRADCIGITRRPTHATLAFIAWAVSSRSHWQSRSNLPQTSQRMTSRGSTPVNPGSEPIGCLGFEPDLSRVACDSVSGPRADPGRPSVPSSIPHAGQLSVSRSPRTPSCP